MMHGSKSDKIVLAARILIGLLFLVTGLQMATGYDGAVAYAASAGVPMAGIAIIIAIIVKVGGSLGLILGYKVKESAYALIAFTVLTILFFHFDMSQIVNALKNLAIIGGLALLAVHGPGAIVWKMKS